MPAGGRVCGACRRADGKHAERAADAALEKQKQPLVLKLSPADVDALKCRAVAHLQLGEYEEAWKALGHRKLEGEMTFERVRSRLFVCLFVH